MSDYAINNVLERAGPGWVADIPDLQHCSALGANPQEALVDVLEAKQAWIESAGKHGEAVPEPRYRPAIYAAGSKP